MKKENTGILKPIKNEVLKEAIVAYFETLQTYGRTVSSCVNPMPSIIADESKRLKYLDDNDLYCWSCGKHLVVIQIDYRTQRPVWGCLACRATKGLQKIKRLDHCCDCGRKLNLLPHELEEQDKYMENGHAGHCCEKCLGNGNILTEEDMKNVQFREPVN